LFCHRISNKNPPTYNKHFKLWESYMKLQRFGGYAALASVCAWLAAVLLFILAMAHLPGGFLGLDDLTDPVKMMEATSAAPGNLYAGYLLLVASYILALIMALALHERMQSSAPYLTRLMVISASAATLMQLTEAIVFIRQAAIIAQTQDISAWRALTAITDGLHFTAGHLCAWSVLISGCAILRTRALSRMLGWVLFVAGILWLPRFAVPQLGLVPGLLSWVGAIWTGIALLRGKQPQPVSGEMADAIQS
jgi:hypothetical protein